MSPVTMPSDTAPGMVAASPVRTPPRACIGNAFGLAQRLHRIDQLERRTHRALGVVLVGDGRAPHRHHRVADELLDRASVPFDHRASGVEVGAQQRAHVLAIALFRQGREPDQIDE